MSKNKPVYFLSRTPDVESVQVPQKVRRLARQIQTWTIVRPQAILVPQLETVKSPRGPEIRFRQGKGSPQREEERGRRR